MAPDQFDVYGLPNFVEDFYDFSFKQVQFYATPIECFIQLYQGLG
jgi:hypothetical protein